MPFEFDEVTDRRPLRTCSCLEVLALLPTFHVTTLLVFITHLLFPN